MSELQSVEGMHDLLPEDHEYFTFIKKVIRYHGRRSGFKRISVPALEKEDMIFSSCSNLQTECVDHLFKVEGKESLYLRSNMRSGIARAYIAHNMVEMPKPVQFYYIEPSWRKDASDGMLRQFYQFGFEILGEQDPALDAQVIEMCKRIFEDLGLKDVQLRINSVGTKEDRVPYEEALRNFYAGKERSLCQKCVDRFEKSPMMLIECKEEDCKILANLAPKVEQFLSKNSKQHYDKVKEYLATLEIQFQEDPFMLRDLLYYSGVVFEFYVVREGHEIKLGGGGRYDALIKDMGGVETPAVGFAAGMERVMELMKEVHIRVPSKDKAHVFMVQLGEDAKRIALKLVSELRKVGIKTVGALGKDSIRSQLESASKIDVKYALVMGQMEVHEKKIIVRDMKKGTQEIMPLDSIVDYLVELIGPEHLDTKDFQGMIEEASESDE